MDLPRLEYLANNGDVQAQLRRLQCLTRLDDPSAPQQWRAHVWSEVHHPKMDFGIMRRPHRGAPDETIIYAYLEDERGVRADLIRVHDALQQLLSWQTVSPHQGIPLLWSHEACIELMLTIEHPPRIHCLASWPRNDDDARCVIGFFRALDMTITERDKYAMAMEIGSHCQHDPGAEQPFDQAIADWKRYRLVSRFIGQNIFRTLCGQPLLRLINEQCHVCAGTDPRHCVVCSGTSRQYRIESG